MSVYDTGIGAVRRSAITRYGAAAVIIALGFFMPWLTGTDGTTTGETMLYGTSRLSDATDSSSEWAPPLLMVGILLAVFAGRCLTKRGDRTDEEAAPLRTVTCGAVLIMLVAVTYYCRGLLLLGPERRVPTDVDVTIGSGAIAAAVVGAILVVDGLVQYRAATSPSPFPTRRAVWIERFAFTGFLGAIATVVAVLPQATYTVDGERVATAGFDGAYVGIGTLSDGTPAADIFDGWSAMSAVLLILLLGAGVSSVHDQRITDEVDTLPRGGRLPWVVVAAFLALATGVQLFLGMRWSVDVDDVGVEYDAHVGIGIWVLAAIAIVMGVVGLALRLTRLACAFASEPTNEVAPLEVVGDYERWEALGAQILLHQVISSPTYFYRGEPVSVRHRPPLDVGAMQLAKTIDGEDFLERAIELSGIGEWRPTPVAVGDASVVFEQVVEDSSNRLYPLENCPFVELFSSVPSDDGTMLGLYSVVGAVDGRPNARHVIVVKACLDAKAEVDASAVVSVINAAYNRYAAQGFGSMSYDEWAASPEFVASERPASEYRMKTNLVRAWKDYRGATFHSERDPIIAS